MPKLSKKGIEEQREIALELDRRLWTRVLESVSKELFGETRLPANESEMEELGSTMALIRDRSLLWKYKPHKKQLYFHMARNKIKIFCGSNQSGKTTAILVDDLCYLIGYRPWLLSHPDPPLSILTRPNAMVSGGKMSMIAASDYVNSHNEVIIPKIKELVPFDHLTVSLDRVQGKVIHKIHWWNGSTQKLMSYDQIVDKYEGATWDRVSFDEPPPRPVFIAVARGCMARSAPMHFAFTPLKEPWIYDELYTKGTHVGDDKSFEDSKGKKIFIVTIDLSENPHVNEESKKIFLESLDPEEVEARAHGRFVHLMGRVYKSFSREQHVVSPSLRFIREVENYPIVCCVDPHSRRPFAIGWCAVTPQNKKVWIAEWPDEFLIHEVKSWEWGVVDYIKRIAEIESGDNPHGIKMRNVVWRIMDPAFGTTPGAQTGMTLQEAFLAGADLRTRPEENEASLEGLYFSCDASRDIDQRHLLVKEALKLNELTGEPNLLVLDNCRNIIKMFESYTWSDHKSVKESRAPKEQPNDTFKDFADVIGYVEVSDLGYFDPETGLTPEVDYEGMKNMGLN